MLLVFLGVLQEDKEVIDIHPYGNPVVISRSVIDNRLHCRWCIAAAKGHDNPFKAPKLRVEGSVLDIFVMDSKLVEITDKVDLCKYGGAPQCTQYGLDRR